MYTLTYVTNKLAELIDDTSHTRWSQTQKEQAIAMACEEAWPKWFEVDTLSITYSDREYTLPEGIEFVTQVFVKRTSNDPYIIRGWSFVNGVLRLERPPVSLFSTTSTFYVDVVYRPRSLVNKSYTANISSKTVTANGATFLTDGIRPGDRIKVGSTQTRVATVDSETQLTTVSALGDGTGVTITINDTTDIPLTPLLYDAASHLYMREGAKGNKVDVSQQMQWARFYKEMAELEWRRAGKQLPARRR